MSGNGPTQAPAITSSTEANLTTCIDPRATSAFYVEDETGWLEAVSRLISDRKFDAIDPLPLSEYLADMAKRDRREVKRRLAVLLANLLKWDFQPAKRTKSWEKSIADQRAELDDLLESGTLRQHADHVLDSAYRRAVQSSSIETGLAESTFPAVCPYSFSELLAEC
jgi:hypothetical protein